MDYYFQYRDRTHVLYRVKDGLLTSSSGLRQVMGTYDIRLAEGMWLKMRVSFLYAVLRTGVYF